MKECLVTKLKADTGNNSLLRAGEMFIDIIKQASPTNQTNRLYLKNESEDIVLEVEDGSANLTTDENMATGWVSKMTLPKSASTNTVFVRNGDYRIKVKSKYTMSKIGEQSPNMNQKAISVSTKYLRFNKILDCLIVGAISGNIADLSKTKLKILLGSASQLTGDIASLAPLTSLNTLDLNPASQLTGDIASLAPLTSLTFLRLSSASQLTGNIASLAPLTSLTYLQLSNCTHLTGDIASLAPLTSLNTLGLSGASQITGDIKNIKNPVTNMSLFGTKVSGELIEFVKTQRAQGRTTGSCKTGWWGSLITFNGVVPSASDTNLTWTETSITLGSTTVNQ